MPMNSICPNSTDRDAGIAHAVAAIRTRRQELEHEIQKLTADCNALARAEGLVAHDRPLAPEIPRPRGSNRREPGDGESDLSLGDSAFPTGLRKAICALAEKLPERFTAPDVLSQLQAQGFKFVGNPKAAVRDAMYVLSRGKEQIFRIAEAGTGGRPNEYERV
jgi:hypothetical protein